MVLRLRGGMFHETSNRAGFQNLHEDDSDFESDDDDNDKNNPLKTNPISHQMMTTNIKGEKKTINERTPASTQLVKSFLCLPPAYN